VGRAGYDLSVNKIGYMPEKPAAAQPPTDEQVAATHAFRFENRSRSGARSMFAPCEAGDVSGCRLEGHDSITCFSA
jgi:hypothetical protein